jgi:hypothetical protein
MMLLHGHEMAVPERLQLSNTIVAQFIEGTRPLIPGLAD